MSQYVEGWGGAQRSAAERSTTDQKAPHPIQPHSNTPQHTYPHRNFCTNHAGQIVRGCSRAVYERYVELLIVALGIITMWFMWECWPYDD